MSPLTPRERVLTAINHGEPDRISLILGVDHTNRISIHADWIAYIKNLADAKVFFHSNGDITSLLDDLFEIGVDILNPIKISTGRMADLSTLKKRYGTRLCFCGAIDTQHILPRSSPEEVREEVRRAINLLGPNGCYLVASVHSILDEVPTENIVALADSVETFGYYPLS